MSASSLIFFVILAVWAAYMLKHWVRRRENLATARTVDRFSEAMRMLERRTPVKADVTTRGEESQEPQRTILRPQVSVKGATRVQAPEEVSGTDVKGADHAKNTPAGPSSARPARSSSAPSHRSAAALANPKVKLGALVGSLAFFVVTAVLAPFTSVPAWLPLLGLVAVAGVVTWLRRSAIAARQARAAAPLAQRPARRSGAQVSRPARDVMASAEVAPADGHRAVKAAEGEPAVAGATRVEVAPAVAASEVRAAKRSPLVAEVDVASLQAESDVVFDQEPSRDAAARAEAELFDNAAWAPVEVPRPTYTMKAKAEREAAAPAATVDEVDARPLAAQYANASVEELPFDGMALDEDYEDLPQVYRAG